MQDDAIGRIDALVSLTRSAREDTVDDVLRTVVKTIHSTAGFEIVVFNRYNLRGTTTRWCSWSVRQMLKHSFTPGKVERNSRNKFSPVSSRYSQTSVRLGGDEFLLYMPGTNLQQRWCERGRRADCPRVAKFLPRTSNVAGFYPFQVLLPVNETGLEHASKAYAAQLRSVGRERISPTLGDVAQEPLFYIDETFRPHLPLRRRRASSVRKIDLRQ